MNRIHPKTSKVVFFDIGSTLIKGPTKSPAKRLAEIMGLSIKDLPLIEDIIFLKRINSPCELYHRLKEEFDDHGKIELDSLEMLWKEQLKEAHEIIGASDLVLALKKAGFRLGVISNIWKPYFLSFVENCPKIYSNIDAFFLSYEVGAKKPACSMFKAALEFFSANPENCIMIGDSYMDDLYPALSLGMRTIWILSRPENELDSILQILTDEKPKPDLILRSLQEATLERINTLISNYKERLLQ